MIKPYVNPRPVPEMCWLLDEKTVLHESFIELDLADCDKEMQVWSSVDLVTRLLAEGKGESLTWDNKPIRWSPTTGSDEWPVRVLRLVTPRNPETAMEGLVNWRDWLAQYRAAPAGSLGGSGMSLLKGTLRGPLWTSAGQPPPIRFTLGGRQELGPRGAPAVFQGPLRHWDIQAAYARTLGNLNYGGWWREIRDTRSVTRLLERATGNLLFVNAKIRIPAQEWAPNLGPLPIRPRREPDPLSALVTPVPYPTGRDVQGTWTAWEIRQAVAWGCQIIRVLGGWYHFAKPDSYPFRPWLAAVEDGRSMSGFASILAKATGNATWGQFAIRRQAKRSAMSVNVYGGQRHRVFREVPMQGSGNPSQRAPDLAESVTGKVRAELYRGMMQAGEELVCAHTDGLWLMGRTYVQGWRSKDAANEMRLINPQNFSHHRPKELEDRYTVSGVPVQSAGVFFEDEWERIVRATHRPYALRERDREKEIPVYQFSDEPSP